MSFTKKILSSMLFGIVLGLFINIFLLPSTFIETFIINDILSTVASLFLILLKMIVLPLIFVSIISGIVSVSDISTLGRIGIKTFALYVLTTIFAISLALFLSSFIDYDMSLDNNAIIEASNLNQPDTNIILSFFPENFFAALASGNIIQVLVFAIFIGVASAMIKSEVTQFINLIENLNRIFNKIVFIIIKMTPLAVFCLLTKTFALQGIDVFIPLLKYFFVVASVLVIHFVFTYSLILRIFSNLSIKAYYSKLKSLFLFTFSTSSSNASIPFTLDTVTNKYGVNKSVASFSIPLGATINMDGTAIMQGCATFFLASYYGINLELNDYLIIIFTATIASIGTAGIPSAGIFMLSLILTEVGIPLEGITLLLGVDRLLDMLRTSINVSGDTCITCVVAQSENLIDHETFVLINANKCYM